MTDKEVMQQALIEVQCFVRYGNMEQPYALMKALQSAIALPVQPAPLRPLTAAQMKSTSESVRGVNNDQTISEAWRDAAAAQPVQPADSAKPVRMCPVTDTHCKSECPPPISDDMPVCDNPPNAQPVQPADGMVTVPREPTQAMLDAGASELDDTSEIYRAMIEAAQPVQPAPVAQAEPSKPYAYAVYFPDMQTEELVHDLDDACEPMTNNRHTVTPLYDHPAKDATP